jgi:hypothetical protein
MARKMSKAKRAEEIAAIRERLEDLYIGATGSRFDDSFGADDLLAPLDCHQIERFITAIRRAFEWRTPENYAGYVYGLQYHYLDKFESFDRLAEHVFDSLVEKV